MINYLLHEILPNELLNIIFLYIPDVNKLRLNKYYYKKYHKIVIKYLIKNNIESYIRFMIRRDNEFVIKHLIKENHVRWFNFKNYYYKGLEFDNYISFLKYYSSENNSNKCETEINNFMKKI